MEILTGMEDIDFLDEEEYSFYDNGYQYLRNISDCSMLSMILKKENEEYIRKKYAYEPAQFAIKEYSYRGRDVLIYNDFGYDASGKVFRSEKGFRSCLVAFSVIRLNKAYKDQSTMKSMF